MADNERDKLKTLLDYWIAHNEEHSQEFREWAEKARASGDAEIAEEILQAAQAMDKAGNLLSQLLERLKEA